MAGTIFGHAFPITPSDSTVLPPGCTAIYVGGTGVLTIETLQGSEVSFGGVPAGCVLSIQARKVKASTTATLLVGLVT